MQEPHEGPLGCAQSSSTPRAPSPDSGRPASPPPGEEGDPARSSEAPAGSPPSCRYAEESSPQHDGDLELCVVPPAVAAAAPAPLPEAAADPQVSLPKVLDNGERLSDALLVLETGCASEGPEAAPVSAQDTDESGRQGLQAADGAIPPLAAVLPEHGRESPPLLQEAPASLPAPAAEPGPAPDGSGVEHPAGHPPPLEGVRVPSGCAVSTQSAAEGHLAAPQGAGSAGGATPQGEEPVCQEQRPGVADSPSAPATPWHAGQQEAEAVEGTGQQPLPEPALGESSREGGEAAAAAAGEAAPDATATGSPRCEDAAGRSASSDGATQRDGPEAEGRRDDSSALCADGSSNDSPPGALPPAATENDGTGAPRVVTPRPEDTSTRPPRAPDSLAGEAATAALSKGSEAPQQLRPPKQGRVSGGAAAPAKKSPSLGSNATAEDEEQSPWEVVYYIPSFAPTRGAASQRKVVEVVRKRRRAGPAARAVRALWAPLPARAASAGDGDGDCSDWNASWWGQ